MISKGICLGNRRQKSGGSLKYPGTNTVFYEERKIYPEMNLTLF